MQSLITFSNTLVSPWATHRPPFPNKYSDKELAKRLLYPLVKNTNWWMASRMSRYGLIYCSDPLETGWDTTPRLDTRPVLACDMNAYVLMQMRACAEMADMVGDRAIAESERKRADRLAQRMVDVLYNKDDGLFHEVHIPDGSFVSIKTPTCFLPLLAGVPLPQADIHSGIQNHLLNPKEFFGSVPFPSVAYDEPQYDPKRGWRGPTWMPVAYLMLEVLRMYGFDHAYREAADRLYKMIITDGRICEFFNSQTGEGMGAKQQGWTAAILLWLHAELCSKD